MAESLPLYNILILSFGISTSTSLSGKTILLEHQCRERLGFGRIASRLPIKDILIKKLPNAKLLKPSTKQNLR